jgi:thiamine biosynthesis lipoprotein
VIQRFRSMGCEVAVGGDQAAAARARWIFEEDDQRFTRFSDSSELARVNRAQGPVLVSERFARALEAALTAARQTDGLVDCTLLDAIEAAGYDRDFDELDVDGPPPRAGAHGQATAVALTGRLLVVPHGVRLDLNGVVKALAVDDALAAIGRGWVSAGGDVATSRPLEVALPDGEAVRLERGALATSGSAKRHWRRGGELQHHLIDPATGRPARSPWEQVTVCGGSCLTADVAAKAAFLLGDAGPGWLDARAMPGRFLRADGAVLANETWRRALAGDVPRAAALDAEVACI